MNNVRTLYSNWHVIISNLHEDLVIMQKLTNYQKWMRVYLIHNWFFLHSLNDKVMLWRSSGNEILNRFWNKLTNIIIITRLDWIVSYKNWIKRAHYLQWTILCITVKIFRSDVVISKTTLQYIKIKHNIKKLDKRTRAALIYID